MTLPVGTISMSQVNDELGLPSTTNISLNQANVRALAGVPSGTISMNDLRGKSNFTLGFNNADEFNAVAFASAFRVDSTIEFYNNGSIDIFANITARGPTAYGSPIAAGVGSGCEISLYINSTSSTNIVNTFTAFGTVYSGSGITTPWVPLSSTGTMQLRAFHNGASEGSIVVLGDVRIRKIGSGTSITRGFFMYAECQNPD
jgi:hypothetical protein